jgi:hypothetical protein
MRFVSALALLWLPAMAQKQILIVADEFPAMETFAAKLKAGEGIGATLVKQTEMPADWSGYSAVAVYIHGGIRPEAEARFIEYAQNGGRLLLLHHSISSGKRKNKDWFPFLKIELPDRGFPEGGYKWIDPVTMDIVKLADHSITTRHITYPARVEYESAERPGFRLEETEVYLNHVFLGPRQTLLGLRYTYPETGKVFMQPSAGWFMRAGKGWVLYFMPGHSVKEFSDPVYGQIVVNAVVAKLED